MRFQVTSKLIRPNSWITQTVRQRIPNGWARNGESMSAESAATDAWNDELTATGGSQMLAVAQQCLQNSVTPEPIDWKFDTRDYVGELTSYGKFHKNRQHKDYPAIWWNVYLAYVFDFCGRYFLGGFTEQITEPFEALNCLTCSTVGNIGS